jgi:cell division protein ZapA (FtsZ GTPase activity inhibitor)
LAILTEEQVHSLQVLLQQNVDSYDHANTRLMGMVGLAILDCLSELKEINAKMEKRNGPTEPVAKTPSKKAPKAPIVS